MRIASILRAGVVGALAVWAGAGTAQAPGLKVLAGVSGGQWQFHEIGSRGTGRSLCVHDVAMLLQLRHSGAQCSRFVLDSSAKAATVHYTCPGSGHGLTTLSVESGQLIRLKTQGIADGAPFDDDWEGRRVGGCGA
jgi:hypothetical protein